MKKKIISLSNRNTPALRPVTCKKKGRIEMYPLRFLIVVLSLSLAAPGYGGKDGAVSEQKAQETVEKPHDEKSSEAKHEDRNDQKKDESIVLTPEAAKNVGLATTPVSFKSVREKVAATATIAHNQDRVFQVTPRINGRVLELYVSVGSSVTKGQRLALLDSTTIGEIRSEFLKTKTLLELAKANYEREKSLFDQKIAAKKDVLTAEAEYRKAEAEVRSLEEKLRLYGFSEAQISNIETA
jgi:cobalt-zinc-cadmium efflux system membrane fusion protein